WRYTYNALGKLTSVSGPPGPEGEPIQRTWHYNSKNLLDYEIQPESGRTNYTEYDGAGNLRKKTDANGTPFEIVYDGNDRVIAVTAGNRVTVTTYESGSDSRQTLNVDEVSTEFEYDAAGRLKTRSDEIDGHWLSDG